MDRQMLTQRQEAIIRLVELQFELYRTLRAPKVDAGAPPELERAWAELLCLLPALGSGLHSLDTALPGTSELLDRTHELAKQGAVLCRLHRQARATTEPGSRELQAASEAAVEALLAGLTEWISAVAQTGIADKPLRLTTPYPFPGRPPGTALTILTAEATSLAAMSGAKTKAPVAARPR